MSAAQVLHWRSGRGAFEPDEFKATLRCRFYARSCADNFLGFDQVQDVAASPGWAKLEAGASRLKSLDHMTLADCYSLSRGPEPARSGLLPLSLRFDRCPPQPRHARSSPPGRVSRAGAMPSRGECSRHRRLLRTCGHGASRRGGRSLGIGRCSWVPTIRWQRHVVARSFEAVLSVDRMHGRVGPEQLHEVV